MIDDVLRFCNHVCVPSDDDLSHKILTEVYSSLYTTHLKSVKMYQDLKKSFWWSSMKKDIANFLLSIWCVNRLRLTIRDNMGYYNL